MRLCLVRHGIAIERTADVPDAERPLEAAAIDRTRAALLGVMALFTPEVILTSPWRRAHETAAIAASIARLPRPVDCNTLANGDLARLLETLRDTEASAAMLVGHEPGLSRLASLLLTGDESALQVQLKKASAALIETDPEITPGQAVLLWVAQPAALRRIGRTLAM